MSETMMPAGEASRFDVVVVGGAFSGSATALLLKRSDPSLRILIVEEKRSFDRKVGESAIELASWFLTRVLNLDRHLAIHQLPKYGQRYWFTNDNVRTLADCSELGNRYQTRVPSYHLDRSRLDEHVEDLAVQAGVELLRPARVTGVELRDGGHSLLSIEADGAGRTVSARWVIDATGRSAWLGRKLGLLIPMPEHPTRAIWARYRCLRDFDSGWLPERAGMEGAARSAVCSRALSTNHMTGLGYWVWAIPLRGGEISVGVVWDDRLMDLPPGRNVGERFESFLKSFPAGRELMEQAVRLEDDLHALNHLSYRLRQVMGDGWAMVGDAAGFLDPFYSPGLDWGAVTVAKTVAIVSRTLRAERAGRGVPAGAGAAGSTMPGPGLQTAIDKHNREFTLGFYRWFDAIYRDKYYYMGDAELMEVALRMDVALYYFGIVTPPYLRGIEALEVPFAPPISAPFRMLISFVNRRLVSIARARLAAGTYGRANAGRRVLLGGFKLGPSSLKHVPGVLWRLALLELRAIPDRLGKRAAARLEAQRAGSSAPLASVDEGASAAPSMSPSLSRSPADEGASAEPSRMRTPVEAGAAAESATMQPPAEAGAPAARPATQPPAPARGPAMMAAVYTSPHDEAPR